MKITKTRLMEIIKEEVIKEVGVDEKTRYLVRAFSPNPRKRGEALIFQVLANSPEEAIKIATASPQTDDSQPIEIIKESEPIEEVVGEGLDLIDTLFYDVKDALDEGDSLKKIFKDALKNRAEPLMTHHYDLENISNEEIWKAILTIKDMPDED